MSMNKSMWRFRHLDWSSLLLVTPAMTFFSVFVIYPIIQTVWLSLWKWDRISPGVWVGLDNYKKVLTNPEIYSAFSHSLVFVLFYSVIPITIGLFITLLLLRVKVKGETFFRAVLFVPQIISTVVVAISWRWIYAADGPINTTLTRLGGESLTTAWLGNFDTVEAAVAAYTNAASIHHAYRLQCKSQSTPP